MYIWLHVYSPKSLFRDKFNLFRDRSEFRFLEFRLLLTRVVPYYSSLPRTVWQVQIYYSVAMSLSHLAVSLRFSVTLSMAPTWHLLNLYNILSPLLLNSCYSQRISHSNTSCTSSFSLLKKVADMMEEKKVLTSWILINN